MFNLKFADTFDFSIMRENKLEHVLEDYFEISGNTFCVADGITRDLIDGTPLSYPKNLDDALNIIKKYPNPSGATAAAKICAKNFIKYVSNENSNNLTENDILQIVKKINADIANLNSGRKIDYLTNDYFCCVAVGGIIQENTLLCFGIGDCKIRVLDKNCNTIFDTSFETLSRLPAIKTPLLLRVFRGKWNWANPSYRVYIRKRVRNNSWLKFIKKHSFGALTGEHKAIPFVKTFRIPLDDAKYILAFSDGCDDCLKTVEQTRAVIANPSQIKNEQHEKTLIIFEKE